MENLYPTIANIHGYWAILVIILGIVTLILSLIDYFKKQPITPKFRKLTYWTTMVFHIQILMGLVLIMINSNLFSDLSYKIGGKVTFIEHLSSGLLAVLFITVFNAKVKKSSHISGMMVVFIILAVLCISRAIPLVINLLTN